MDLVGWKSALFNVLLHLKELIVSWREVEVGLEGDGGVRVIDISHSL